VTDGFARHGGGEYGGVPLDDEKQTIRAWFGLAEPFDWRKRSYLGPFLFGIGVLIVCGLFSLAIAAAFKLLGAAVFGGLPQGAGSSFGLTGIIVAMIGAPFVVWRAVVAQKQVDVAEQGQITDRISKAVEGLGAEKTVKDAGEETTEPNLEVRIGAIYALERIAQDSLRDHIQIMEILCAYIRENAPLRETPKNPFEVWEVEDYEGTEKAEMPKGAEMRDWARSLQKPRTDIQVALEVIGRRKPRQIKIERSARIGESEIGYRLDLRSTCLQGADLNELNFADGLFSKAQLQGANLSFAHFDDVILNGAKLQGAVLGAAYLQRAHLIEAKLQGAILSSAELQRSRLHEAKLQGAELIGTTLLGARLIGTQLQGADLTAARLQGAILAYAQFDESAILFHAFFRGAVVREIDFSVTLINPDQLLNMFGDGTVILPGGHGPDHESWPVDWSKEKLSDPDFNKQHRAFQRSIGQDPDNPT
jgi:uncharacterized protein YjbI with pentapeptide repeats